MPGLIERYREHLPFADGDPVVSLGEGSTPLVSAPHLSERVGAEVWLKLEGANPTGSFKDRGMTCAVSAAAREGAEAVICASTGNTAASAAAYAARGGLTGAVIVPEGKIATGKLAQALMHGARVIALRGNFDQALTLVRELVERHPIALVNSVNEFRLQGQKTAAFELIEDLGDGGPDALCIPVGNAGNVTAYWKGFVEAGVRPSSSASRRRARRRWSRARASRSPRRWRAPSASATRPAGRRRWAPSPSRAAWSARSATRRSSPRTACSPRARGSSASRRRRPRWPGCSSTASTGPSASPACSPATA
jgi:threonine synthase